MVNILVQGIMQALTALHENPNKRLIKNQSFNFEDVRATVLSYLICSDALTSTRVECPNEMISRVTWLQDVFTQSFCDTYDFLEYVEETA